MILDTSVILALALDEPTAGWVERMLLGPDARKMSWANLAEVAIRLRHGNDQAQAPLEGFIRHLQVELLGDTFESIRLVADARLKFPLHFGDCFAYAHARLLNEPLLTLDADFLKTDLPRILHPARTP